MIHREPPPGAVAPLPFGPTVALAYRLVLANLAALAKLTALPFVLTLLIGHIAVYLDVLSSGLVWEFGLELPWCLMAVAWLRLLLLAPNRDDAVFFPKLRARHGRLLGYALALSVLFLPLTFFSPLADGLGLAETERNVVYWALYVVLLYVGLRFSFVYAAAAVDEPYSFAIAWRHTRAIAWPLFLAVGLTAMLPWHLFTLLLSHLAQGGAEAAFAAALLWHVGLWMLEALYLAFVVVAFRTCTGWVPAPDQAVLERFE